MGIGRSLVLLVVGFASSMAIDDSYANDKIRVASAWTGLWDTSQPTFCADRGEFAKAGLDVEVMFTPGNAVMAVVAGGMDIGYSPGTNGVLAAYAGGSKIKIISSEFVGQNDTFFYVRADSSIKSIDDLNGKSVGFSRPGSAAEAIVQAVKAEHHLNFKAVSTGSTDATRTMVMTRQVDVGYSVPPSGLDAVKNGEIRVLFSGDEAKSLSNITGRVVVVSADFLKQHRAAVVTFMRTLDQCIDWVYAHPTEAAKLYADINKINIDVAEEAMRFYKREGLAFGPLRGMDDIMKQAVEGKFIQAPLTNEQRADLLDIVYTRGN